MRTCRDRRPMIPEYLSKSSSVTNTNEDTAKILNVNNGSLSLFQKIAPARIMAAGNQLIARISTIKPNSPRFISEYKNATKDIMISARRMQIRFFRPIIFSAIRETRKEKPPIKSIRRKKTETCSMMLEYILSDTMGTVISSLVYPKTIQRLP